jgi:hypothetical protein
MEYHRPVAGNAERGRIAMATNPGAGPVLGDQCFGEFRWRDPGERGRARPEKFEGVL